MDKSTTLIDKRVIANKESLLARFKVNPIIEIACKKIGIGRASYYRWRKEDSEFAKQSDKAILEGRLLITEMAESQLISQIKDRNMTALIFWLKHNHATYGNRLEITTPQKENKNLTTEQQQAITEALRLGSLDSDINHKTNKDEK